MKNPQESHKSPDKGNYQIPFIPITNSRHLKIDYVLRAHFTEPPIQTNQLTNKKNQHGNTSN